MARRSPNLEFVRTFSEKVRCVAVADLLTVTAQLPPLLRHGLLLRQEAVVPSLLPLAPLWTNQEGVADCDHLAYLADRRVRGLPGERTPYVILGPTGRKIFGSPAPEEVDPSHL